MQQLIPKHPCKKREENKNSSTTTSNEDDVHELANVVAKVAQYSLATLDIQQVNIVDQVGNHLNKLMDAINEVKATVEAETYGVDPNVPLATP